MHLELDPDSTEPADQIAIEETVNFKIYKGKDGLKIELSSESDVQFYYRATYKEENFRQIQNDNNLTIEYEQFLPCLEKMVQDCEQHPQLYRIHFTMDDENGNACLRFLHDSEFRKSELMALDNFRQLEDENINQHVSFRINSLKQKTALVQLRINEVMKIVQKNNPPLADIITRTVNSLSAEEN